MTDIPFQLFSAWMGPGAMSDARASALNSIVLHCGVPFNFISNHNIQWWLHPDFPLHPTFPLLSAVHQCDYLRCYVLHVYGGGYTDIKPTNHNWKRFFFQFQASEKKFGAGYTEVGPQGVARVGGPLEEAMMQNYQNLIGVCSLIMVPRSPFTMSWYSQIIDLLDQKSEEIVKNPARHPQDHFGAQFQDGSVSAYPLAWTAVGGDILHPLVFQNHDAFLHLDMTPFFSNYR